MKTSPSRHSRPPLARMLRLHEELSAGRHPNCRSMAREFEVSDKTIQRDFDFMRDQLGLPLEYVPEKFGFRYTEAVTAFPSIQVSEGEMVALFVAQKAMLQYRGTPFEKPLAAAFRKLTQGLKDQVSFEASDWESFYSFRSSGAPVSDLEQFEILGRCLRESLEVVFPYRKLRSREAEERRVEPYHLACVENQWYLFGRDLSRDGVRTFVLGRMGPVRSTGRAFRRPADFSPAKLLAGSFGVFSGDKPRLVRVRFDAFASQLVRERQWHPSQRIREWKDGIEVEMTLTSLPEVERWILSWGAHARVMAPLELRRSIQEALRQALSAYG
ncbi:MAG: WYL domain-containing protein [Candidatus Methylacidiphilales bacterium]|nr:WYL domain-containing protein [Candidatus Methylacidiphilales bacterium]